MEVPDKVGRALPVPENVTSVRAWKFTQAMVSQMGLLCEKAFQPDSSV
jgi:hypothetical protein